MRLLKIIYALILFSVLSSCAGSKIDKTLKQGNIVQKDFKVTVPFEYRRGLIILKVTIENEVYDFILDTGASNVISKELAEKLNVIPLGTEEVGDINKKKQQLKYTKIDDIQIGGINFKETIAAKVDLNSGELACIKADGLIGANLMRFAVWDFDFKNQLITISSDEKKLNIPSDAIESKVYIGTASKLSMTTQVNGKTVLKNLVDLGNTSNAYLSYSAFIKQKKSQKITNYVKGSGYTSIGMYGKAEPKNEYSVKIDNIKIGDHIITNKIMGVKSGSTNLGLPFFKNYRLILNWKSKRLKMIQQSASLNTELNHFGFNPTFEENKIFVGFIYNDTEASKVLQFGDQIVQINGIDYTNLAKNQKCDVFISGAIPKEADEIAIIVLRNEEKIDIQLKKVKLL
ncbi:aspartyl protease family protein [Flavobacterium ardleyense]|uniref:Aspartyl protease family protein n=1 Tax=Flavobacterium ardleyense TaxID=2038737 RepID=A0ABW5ZA06_9FLAO